MSTLNAPTLSALINRLFTEADAAESAPWPARGDRSDYRKYYGLLKDRPLAVSRDTGTLLYMLARAIGARSIVESAPRSEFRRCISRLRCVITAAGV